MLVALYAAETSVSAASSESLSQEVDRDKVLFMSARILSEIKAFVAAVCRTSTAPEQLELASRIRTLLLAAARLAGDLATTAGSRPAVIAEEVDAGGPQGFRSRLRSGKASRSGVRAVVGRFAHKDLSAMSLHHLSKRSLGVTGEVSRSV